MKITEVQLETHRLAEMKTFYTETLGLPLVHANARSFIVRAGNSKLKFSKTKTEEPVYHFAFNIPENKIQESKDWLNGRAALIEKDGKDLFHIEDWNADAVYFFDPAGNIVEFIARHTLKNASNAPFSSDSILSISEIGYVVDEDVRLFSQHIKAELSLKLYSGDEKSFSALGDEEGLVIVVPAGRTWYPTNIVAESFKVALM